MILLLKSIKTSESVSCILVRVLLCISKYFDFIVSPFLCMFKKRQSSYFLLEKDDDRFRYAYMPAALHKMLPYFTNYVNLPQSFIRPWVDFDYFVAQSRMRCFSVNEFSFFLI